MPEVRPVERNKLEQVSFCFVYRFLQMYGEMAYQPIFILYIRPSEINYSHEDHKRSSIGRKRPDVPNSRPDYA